MQVMDTPTTLLYIHNCMGKDIVCHPIMLREFSIQLVVSPIMERVNC